jgi:hypothetical protein
VAKWDPKKKALKRRGPKREPQKNKSLRDNVKIAKERGVGKK